MSNACSELAGFRSFQNFVITRINSSKTQFVSTNPFSKLKFKNSFILFCSLHRYLLFGFALLLLTVLTIYFLLLTFQTVDERFIEEEKRFRGIEKTVKILWKNVSTFLEEFQVIIIYRAQMKDKKLGLTG